jgi:hypothetical protein
MMNRARAWERVHGSDSSKTTHSSKHHHLIGLGGWNDVISIHGAIQETACHPVAARHWRVNDAQQVLNTDRYYARFACAPVNTVFVRGGMCM